MIRRCISADLDVIHTIINAGAQAYKGVIPEDCWHDPYMAPEYLAHEIDSGVDFWGWEESGQLMAVMGLQQVKDVFLIRHAYVLPGHQGKGIGGRLLNFLMQQVSGPLLVGAWADADWAIQFYQRHGFTLVTPSEKAAVLQTYWMISSRQVETSVVLRQEKAA